MTQSFFYQNADLGTTRVRLGSTANITQSAERGTVSTSSVELDDEAGTLVLPPFFGFQWYEDAASQPLIFTGYGSQRTAQRAASLVTGASKRVSLQLEDLNAQLSFRFVNHNTAGYKRPAEDDYHRIDWLLATLLNTTEDNGLIDRDPTTNVSMSACDYTFQTPDKVLQDCSDLSGKNYFLYADATTGNRSLAYFKSTDATFYPSGCFISNDLADVGNADTYFPQKEPVLTLNPEALFNGAGMDYSGGSIYLQHGTDLPLIRDTIIDSSNTSSKKHATALVQKYLETAAFEYETVSCVVAVPPANVNDLLQGMLVTCTFLQFPGWDGNPVRILNRSISTEMTEDRYNITLTLGHPKLVSFGGSGDNGKVWPSDLPPFKPGADGAFTFVQSAKTADATAGGDATFGAAPTAGNFLVAITEPDQPGGGGIPTWEVLFPDGWTADAFTPGIVDDSGAGTILGRDISSKTSDGTETLTEVRWGSAGTVTPATSPNGFLIAAEYDTAGGTPSPASFVAAVVQDDGSGTTTLPAVTPTPGSTALIVWFVGFHPNYNPTVSAGWNIREQYNTTGGSRLQLSYIDRIVTNASGSYSGTLTSPGGTDSTGWVLMGVVYELSAGTPAIGQIVAPESAISDGVRVIYQTNYPYVPGSLVVKVNGVVLAAVDETDPSTGIFTLPYAPSPRAVITWTYNVADPTATGANNPPPPSGGPGTPTDPGQNQGGDGVFRPPQQEYVPAETPDGSRTVFTIVPYIAGNTLVYINGLIQRKGIDWNELSPDDGTIEFTSPPWTGAAITVTAMPLVAPPSGSGFGNPSLYGSGLNADSKSNIQMGPEGDVALRFRCGASSALDSILIQARGGPIYSGGTGGSYTVTVKAVDANGNPTGSALATQTYTPGNPGGAWVSFDTITWSSPATLVAGTLYAIGFHNADGSPLANYVSINNLFVFGGTLNPRQPLFPDTDMAVLVNTGSWLTRTQFTGNFDLTYASGHHDGQGYVQLFTAQYGTLSGTANMVREAFTVSGGDRTVVSCAVRVRRSSGSDPLVLGLYTGAGTLIEAVPVPAATIPISAAGSDNGGSVWAGARFLAPHVLANGASYYLRLSCASGTTYTAAPIRKGTDNGYDPSLVFMDGAGQFTTNSGGTWTDLYTFDTDPPDLQFYLGVST